jgi:hypothetical protein
VDAGPRAPGRRRRHRGRFVALAVALYVASALVATWPAVRHAGDHYLARPAPGYGEAAAGDHLQLGWAFWLVGHQLERGEAPWADPYSFRPEAEAPLNVQGWLLGLPYWPLDRLFGHVWAYDLVVLLSFVAAGGLACWWLRTLGMRRGAALAGGLVFALAPYRVGQSTGHLLGLVAFLLPGMLLALERRRLALASATLLAIPLSGQLHLALGAIPLFVGYAWARLPRALWVRAGAGASAAIVAGVVVQQTVVEDSIAGGGRSLAQVERYSAELSDFATRSVGAGVEELVFAGWLTPLLALGGLGVAARWTRGRGLAWLLGLGALVPSLIALGTNLPLYEPLWRALPPLRLMRVPERLMPIACLALAALVAFGLECLLRQHQLKGTRARAAAAAIVIVALSLDLRVPVFGADQPDSASAAYDAIAGQGTLLELPVIRPDIHYGSVYLGYARQSPRERPQGYATTAPPAADHWARVHRGLSCGRGRVPAYIRYVAVHGGVYRQTGFFASACANRAERELARQGFALVRRAGMISIWKRPRD